MHRRLTSSTLALLALTAPALADVSPAETWQSWVDYYKANGYTVTEGSREDAGATLTLKDVTFAFDPANDAGKVELKVPQVTLVQTGDGGVRTTLADTLTGSIDSKDEEGEPVAVALTANIPGNETVSTGSAADMTHKGTFPQITLTIDSIKTKDATMEKPLTLTVTNAAGQQRNVSGSTLHITSTMTAEKADAVLDVKEEKDGKPTAVKANLSIGGLGGDVDMELPTGVNVANDIDAAIKAGMSVKGKMRVANLTGAFDASGKDGEKDIKADGKFDQKGLSAEVALSRDGLSYQADSDGLNVTVNTAQAPIPLNYALQNASFGLLVPVLKSDAPAPFKFAYSLGGVTLGDPIWDLFDKGRKLSRDPASLDVDVTGMLKVNVDLFDAAAMKAMEEARSAGEADGTAPAADAKPGETAAAPAAGTPAEPVIPTQVAINKVALSAVGAKVDASGELTIPEGGKTDPVGHVNARLEGVNALIDTLVGMGLLNADEVGGYRMMLAMIAKPAPEGGDALVSDIEFKEGGQVFANGQQVK